MKPKARAPSKSLSKHVLQMKFMKKTALETQEKIAEDEQNKLIDSEHWYLNLPDTEINQGKKISVEKSYTVFNATIYGRLSFNGFNPEIEKIMQSKKQGVAGEEEKEEIPEEDIELAEYYQKHYNRRTNKKRKNGNNAMMNGEEFNLENAIENGKFRDLKAENKKRKFMKPNLDD